MGTNYYYNTPNQIYHIGKSSVGWVFALKIYPELGINVYEDWVRVFRYGDILGDGVVLDEYDREVAPYKIEEKISQRQRSWHKDPDELIEDPEFIKYLNSNHAIIHPSGLLLCVKLGDSKFHNGTYQYVEYEFS